MRLLHVTDFHFRQHWFHWLAQEAAHYDACCLTGDLLDLFQGSQTGLRTQIRWVRDWLREFPAPLYVCTGNHDWWPRDAAVVDMHAEGGWLRNSARPGLVLDGASDHRGGYRFTCCPWAHTPAIETVVPSAVLVHAPPLATPVSSEMGNEVGDPDVAAVIGRLAPGSLVLSGHVHQPRRWHAQVGPAWCFNPGVDFSAATPNRIVIDTETKVATFRGWGREIGPVSLGLKPDLNRTNGTRTGQTGRKARSVRPP